MILQPIGDNIVLKIKEKERETVRDSGLIMLNEGTEQALRTDIGEVIAVGEGRLSNNGTLIPLRVKAGDKVMYNKYAGTRVNTSDETYLILKECDLLVIVK